LKITKNSLSNIWYFSLNEPTPNQVQQIEERIRINRRWAYLILLLDNDFQNDRLLGIIDFEDFRSLAWLHYNISSIGNWTVLEMNPNEWRQNFLQYIREYGRFYLDKINDGVYY
jgi:hypothetical protein